MENAIEQFKIYTEPYIEISSSETLKIYHTFRVMELCEEIATKLGLNKEDIYIAKICGLLHDIGRFEQWKIYKTFVDSKSCDHGDLGVEILTENNLLRKFIYDDKYDDIILNSIKFHNKYEILESLSEREKLFAKIVRDADKIDILYLYTIGHIKLEIGEDYFSDSVFQALKDEQQIVKTTIKKEVDRLSVSLGFIFDINFLESIEILKNKNYINQEIDIYLNSSKSKKMKEQLEDIRKIINNYIEKRLENAR